MNFVGFAAVITVFSIATFTQNVNSQTKNVLNNQTDLSEKKKRKPIMLLDQGNKFLVEKFGYFRGNLSGFNLSGSYSLYTSDNYNKQQERLGVIIRKSFDGISIDCTDTVSLTLCGVPNENVHHYINANFVNIKKSNFINSAIEIRGKNGMYSDCYIENSLLPNDIENLTLNNCELDSVKFLIYNSHKRKIHINFNDCLFKSDITIPLTDTMSFSSVHSDRTITLRETPWPCLKYYIHLNKVNLNIFKFPDHDILFIVDTFQSYASQIKLYKQLVEHFADITDEKMVYDIQLQKLINKHEKRLFVNWVEERWSNYGYDKNLIFRNSLFLMLFFFLMNLFVFKYPLILYNGYKIEEFITADQRITDKYVKRWQYHIVKSVLCLVYTGYIFWGVKLSVDQIKLSNLTVTIWIITQYVTGIICLAYIANVIITKV